jgi:hypothetical protein
MRWSLNRTAQDQCRRIRIHPGLSDSIECARHSQKYVERCANHTLVDSKPSTEKTATEVLRINPGFTIESFKRLAVYKDPKDAEHRIDGLRKAGLLEG